MGRKEIKMAKILVEMEDYEFAEACAERLCSFWRIPKENINMLSDIIEYDIEGADKAPSILQYADNFLNWATCQFGAEEITDFIISELEVDLDELFEHLNLELDSYDYLDDGDGVEKCDVLKAYLEENDEFDELNQYLQEKCSNKGHFTIVYGESREVCSYIKW